MRHSVQMKEQTAAVNSSGRPVGAIIDESDYIDYARYYQEYDDDEEVEDYYFSSAAGRARVVIGNRRHGPNGYLSSGRMQARPTPPQVTPSLFGPSSFCSFSAPCGQLPQPLCCSPLAFPLAAFLAKHVFD